MGYTSHHTIKQIRKKLCHSITPELEGFRRPNCAQIEAELCASDLGGLYFGFDYQVAQKRHIVVGYTSIYNANSKYWIGCGTRGLVVSEKARAIE